MGSNAKDGKDCSEAVPLLEKLFDGEASAEEKRVVESHLGACVPCREHQVFLERVSAVVNVTVLPEPPGSYWESLPLKVMARLDAPRRAERTSRFAWILAPARLGWAAGLVAATLLLAIGVETFRTAPPVPQAAKQDSNAPPLLESQPSAAPVTPGPREPRAQGVGGWAPTQETPARPQVTRAEGDSEAATRSAGMAVSTSPRPSAPRSETESVDPLGGEAKEVDTGLRRESKAAAGALAFSAPPAPPPSEVAGDTMKQDLTKNERTTPLADEKRKATLAAQEAVVDVPTATAPVASELGRADAYKESKEAEAATRYRSLDARYTHPETATVASGRVARLAQKDPSAALGEECTAWRGFVRDFPQDANVPSALFRLAECSLRLYEAERTEANRKQAAEDGEAYLKVTRDTEEADEILGTMKRLRLKE